MNARRLPAAARPPRAFSPVAAVPCCADCRHFFNAPALLERQIPGLASLGSGYGAARAEDGLCAIHERYLSSHCRCAHFASRRTEAGAAVAATSSLSKLPLSPERA